MIGGARVNKPEAAKLQGRHVLGMLIAFFAVVFAVNGYMLFVALKTHSGLVALEPYRKGLAYNARIDASERQQHLGWHDEIAVARNGAVSVQIKDRAGSGVSALHVSSVLARPSTADSDNKLDLQEIGPGQFVANAGPLAEGTWILSIEARSSATDAEPIYRARRRLWLKP
jgi:nitrogen fixation protein FixH